MPEAPVVAEGTLADAVPEEVMAAGPLHAYPVTLAAPLAVSVRVPPAHIGPLFVTPESDGAGFTLTVVLAVLVKPLPSFMVTVYTVVTDGVAETADPVEAESVADGAQV